jgi:putative addiction module antidote
MKLKVMTVGSSIGIILPEEALTRLKVANGDFVFLTESQDGYLITAFDLEFEEQMALARTFMRERRQALQELAQ